MNTTLSDEDKKEETDYDDEEDTDPNETTAFNVMMDLKDISLYNVHISASNEESLYSDEEVSYEQLQENHNLMYSKWVDLVEIYKELRRSLKEVQDPKESFRKETIS